MSIGCCSHVGESVFFEAIFGTIVFLLDNATWNPTCVPRSMEMFLNTGLEMKSNKHAKHVLKNNAIGPSDIEFPQKKIATTSLRPKVRASVKTCATIGVDIVQISRKSDPTKNGVWKQVQRKNTRKSVLNKCRT